MKLHNMWPASAVLLFLAACFAAPVSAATVPIAPTGLTATAGTGSIALKWTAPASDGGSAIIGYGFECVGADGKGVSGIPYNGPVSGLTNGIAYNCDVWARNSIGDSPRSNIASATPIGPPQPPTGLTVAPGTAQASFSWVAPSNNGGAAITAYTVTSNPGALTCATTGALSCTMTGLTNGTLYSFTATAKNSLGTSGPSSAVTATIAVANTVPGAPTGLTATLVTTPAPPGNVRVTWVAPANTGGSAITAYNLVTSPGGKSCTTGALSCDLSGLSASTSYSFAVTATNSVGTGPAAGVTYITPGPPGAPTGLTATAGTGSIALKWTAPASDGGSAIIGYGFECVGADGKGVSGIPYNGPVSGLTNGIAYNCDVWARNAMADSPRSSTVSATPVATTTTTTTTTNGWTQVGIGMAFTSASIGSATSYGGIVGGQYYAWNGTSFVADGIALAQVAYGSDGDRWGVASNYAIYHRGASWATVPGGLKQISVGNASNVWGANPSGQIYKWTGTTWTQMPGAAVTTAVAADGTVWVLTSADQIYRWNGSGWTSIPGVLRWISVGGATNVWGVNAGGSVYKFNATTGGWDMPAVPSGSTFIGVSTASDGTTLLLRNDGTLWKK